MTIKDIAAMSGVSVSTVSRVLNSRPDVSERVRSRVMKIVEEQHYVPNNSARDLVITESESVGLVIRSAGNPFFVRLFSVIEAEVRRAGFSLVPCQLGATDEELRAGAALAGSKRLKGLIFLGGRSDYSPEELAGLSVPFVLCSYTNSFGTLPRDSYSSVSINDELTAREGVEQLIERGHRRIAILLSHCGDRSVSELRWRGYVAALEEKGVEYDPRLVLEAGGYEMERAYRAVRELCRSGAEFSALFAISDSQAMAALKALHDCGRRVPEDCSVLSIDGIEAGEYTIPGLSTYVQPVQEMGRRSVELLMELIRGGSGHRQLELRPELRAGGSMGQYIK